MENTTQQPVPRTKNLNQALITVLFLTLILIVGGYFRFLNLNWDESYHLHPDERFLSMVLNSIRPVSSVNEYFNTQTSTLNPNTHGYSFFVYGTFPLFLIRYFGEWIGQVGYDPITIVGRQMSAFIDLFAVILVFFIGYKLYNRRVGLMAAAFYAFAVFPIQQAHFMTVDTFTNTFGLLTVLAAVILLKRPMTNETQGLRSSLTWRAIWPYLLFGMGLGMATASKINAVSLALLLPLVELSRYLRAEKRDENFDLLKIILPVALAALTSIVTFRLLQPYAFSGPGFFSININPDWWNGLKTLQAQSTGEVDFPPALQWTRRASTFSLYNLLFWGLGLPWGITAILSWCGMAFKVFKGKEFLHLPLWIWSLVYFVWQGLAWVSSMRYLLLLYPLLAIFAAWGLDQFISNQDGFKYKRFKLNRKFIHAAGLVLTFLALLGTVVWAFAFSRIYTRPVTRVAASDWIYDNLEGPINLVAESGGQEKNVPVAYRALNTLTSGQSMTMLYQAKASGFLTDLTYPAVQSVSTNNESVQYQLNVLDTQTGQALTAEALIGENPISTEGTVQSTLLFQFNPAIYFIENQLYQFELTLITTDAQSYLSGVPVMNFYYDDGSIRQETLPKINELISSDHAYQMKVSTQDVETISRVEIPFLVDVKQNIAEKRLRLTLSVNTSAGQVTRVSEISDDFLGSGDVHGERAVFTFDDPLILDANQVQDLDLMIEMVAGEGQIQISTPGVALESSWDDALPLPRPSFVPYQDNAGIFRGDLNLEMYWPDDGSKVQRFYGILNQADYFFISSNRQFGTIPRVPERYPLSTYFYRQLLGCEESQDTLDCYYQAEADGRSGNLGFDLLATFTSYPNLGEFEFNDQYAEEAFSVYDHPKVLIFRKNKDYDSQKTWEILNSVDTSKAVFLTPKQADTYKAGEIQPENQLKLSDESLETQQAGGTWSEIFDRNSVLNQHTWLAVIPFYLLFWLLGLCVFPIVRLALPGLKDKGYAFARIIGLLLFALIAFNLGSVNVAVTRTLLWGVLLVLLIASALVAWLTRKDLFEDFRHLWKQMLVEEAVFMLAFVFFLWIRYQNPDLWHPWRGGEKPMDFSYLNAIIKSSTFPAYDPWYAGGYINYYYYGQVLVAMPIKLLGVIPAVAYNILISLWYAMLVVGAFSIGWNFGKAVLEKNRQSEERLFGLAFLAGIASAVFLAVVGNLGELDVISTGLKMLGSAGASLDGATQSQKLVWLLRGLGEMFKGQQLPIGSGTWYWNPSRVIPGEPITEFPFFTFLYADFHAHLIAMPIVMAAVAWCLSLILLEKHEGRLNLSLKQAIAPILLIGAVILGALQPTNTWDYLTLLALAICVLMYVCWRYLPEIEWRVLPDWTRKWVTPFISAVGLFVLTRILYFNFNRYFFPGYSSIGFWNGDKTPLKSYLMHWGLILFVITCWLVWETYQWMATTRVSKLEPYKNKRNLLTSLIVIIVVAFLLLLLLKVTIALVALPLCLLALFLLVMNDDDVKRLAYFMIGTGLLLTIVVELVYLVGDIGRMNVVFKLYHQAWMLLTLPMGLAAATLWRDLGQWRNRTQIAFQAIFTLLIFAALLFPVLATKDKITDRMDPAAPHSLDGMKYMESSTFAINGVVMDLQQDYKAIQWMQDNVVGSPVILEAQAYEYYWGNRYTIYTGLPGVVGWNYHQRQQRAVLRNNAVQERVDEVNAFYLSLDQEFITDYLDKYDVRYIIVGQQEQAFYPAETLVKFETYDGRLWDQVYNEDQTVIYKVR